MRRSLIVFGSIGLVTGAAIAVRWWLDPALGNELTLVTLYGAIMFAVWVGGALPAAFVAAAGYIACNYLFIAPRGAFSIQSSGGWVGLSAYAVTVALIIGLGVALRVAQRSARDRAEILRTTLASIGDAVITTDIAGRVTFLNGQAEALTGWSVADARGKPLSEVFAIVDEATRVPSKNPVDKALESGEAVGLDNHTVLLARDGSERPIDDSAAPIRDQGGKTTGVVLVFRDVSEWRAAQRLQPLLASIVESSDDAIISKSLDGIVTSWNAAAERIFGYTAAEMIGQPINRIIPPELQDEEPAILTRLRNGERIAPFETVRIGKAGQRLDISLAISPLRDTDGRIFGASKVARDITEQRAAEEALKEADRRKNEFLATLAHELRNPLAPIANMVEILKRRGEDPTDRKAATTAIERQLGHIVRLVEDLLDVDRITRGKIVLRRERVDLAQVLRETIESFASQFEELDQQVTVDLPETPVVLEADPVRLAQVFANLFSNASKYTQPGGRISVAVAADADSATISVRDNGIGIAPDCLPRVFELFTQVDESPERAHSGLGIGLTLVRQIVEIHDGTVEASSEGPGLGSEFVVRLPIPVGTAEPAKPAALGEGPTARPRRILVVDDNEDAAASLTSLLELVGHEVHTANDGLTAVSIAASVRPDVVLLDIGLPHKNGYEVCREIRDQAWGENVLVIAVTGWGQEEDRQQSEQAGIDQHLVKPISFAALNALLEAPPANRRRADGPSDRAAHR